MWQPIETAPKDGTQILMPTEWGTVLAFWRDGMWTFFDGIGCQPTGVEYGILNSWVSEEHAPKFWMPLPT